MTMLAPPDGPFFAIQEGLYLLNSCEAMGHVRQLASDDSNERYELYDAERQRPRG